MEFLEQSENELTHLPSVLSQETDVDDIDGVGDVSGAKGDGAGARGDGTAAEGDGAEAEDGWVVSEGVEAEAKGDEADAESDEDDPLAAGRFPEDKRLRCLKVKTACQHV